MSGLLFNSPTLLAIDKPAGLASAPRSTHLHKSDTALDNAAALLAEQFPELRTLPDLGLVHRLDTETSGVLVFARTLEEHGRLRSLWSTGNVEKLYWARVRGKINLQLPHTIDFAIGHSAKSAKRMIVLDAPTKLRQIRGHALEAHTIIREIHAAPEGFSDLLLELHQGVRHQLRVHLAAVGMPILGDKLYSKDPAERMYLHATSVVVDGLNITSPKPF